MPEIISSPEQSHATVLPVGIFLKASEMLTGEKSANATQVASYVTNVNSAYESCFECQPVMESGGVPTTVIGSFPKPDYLAIPDWFSTGVSSEGAADATRKFNELLKKTMSPSKSKKNGIKFNFKDSPNSNNLNESPSDSEVTSECSVSTAATELEKNIMRATEEVVSFQRDCGIHVVTDGEVRRENYVHHFCRRLTGIDFENLTQISCRNGAYTCFVPTVVGEVAPKSKSSGTNVSVTEWRKSQEKAAAIQKANLSNNSSMLSEGSTGVESTATNQTPQLNSSPNSPDISFNNSESMNVTADPHSEIRAPVKFTLPGPMTIIGTIHNKFYEDEKELAEALALVVNAEAIALARAGCRFIQIDEPVFCRRSDAALEWGIEMLNRCFEGVQEAYEDFFRSSQFSQSQSDDVDSETKTSSNFELKIPRVERSVHMCCGYPDHLDQVGYMKAPKESYVKLAPSLDANCPNVDAISIEDAHCKNDLGNLLVLFKQKTIIFGAVQSACSRIETEEEIEARLREALKYIDRERLVVAPDCGLGLLNKPLIKKKLLNMCAAAKKCCCETC